MADCMREVRDVLVAEYMPLQLASPAALEMEPEEPEQGYPSLRVQLSRMRARTVFIAHLVAGQRRPIAISTQLRRFIPTQFKFVLHEFDFMSTLFRCYSDAI